MATLPKFVVGEYVYDLNRNIWKIVSVFSNATSPKYNAVFNNQKQSFEENEILKINEGARYFNNLYDEKIQEYQNILNEINQRILDL